MTVPASDAKLEHIPMTNIAGIKSLSGTDVKVFIKAGIKPALSAKPAAIIITSTNPNGGNLVKLPTIFDNIQSNPFLFNKLIISIFSLLPGATADMPEKTPESTIIRNQKNKKIQKMCGNLLPTRSIHPTNFDKSPLFLAAKITSSFQRLKYHNFVI